MLTQSRQNDDYRGVVPCAVEVAVCAVEGAGWQHGTVTAEVTAPPPRRVADDAGARGGRRGGPGRTPGGVAACRGTPVPERCATAPRAALSSVPVLTVPVETERPETWQAPHTAPEPDIPWITVVHNDPVNLMSYVTYVFQTYFGYSKEKATQLMLEVHKTGRAAVSSGSREEMERDVQAMHGYGLWATLERDG